jgi:hypothetical protein
MTTTPAEPTTAAAEAHRLNLAGVINAFIGNKSEQRQVGGIIAVVLGAALHKSLGTAPTVAVEAVAGAVLALESLGEHFGLKL